LPLAGILGVPVPFRESWFCRPRAARRATRAGTRSWLPAACL